MKHRFVVEIESPKPRQFVLDKIAGALAWIWFRTSFQIFDERGRLEHETPDDGQRARAEVDEMIPDPSEIVAKAV